MGLADLRRSYDGTPLTESDLHDDPLVMVARWVAEARDELESATEVNAMAVATADARGRPSVRMALLKDLDERGLTFFTNLDSRKGRELRENPYASLCLHWQPIYRQIRVSGPTVLVDRDEVDAYFATRPADSRRGAWASEQSAPIADRAAIEARMEELGRRFPDDDAIPTPTNWGGYRVEPDEVELWQGRPDRLHDRFLWTREGGGWRRERLQP
jgi:pyridoxamine 5'-phosphate oxidase